MLRDGQCLLLGVKLLDRAHVTNDVEFLTGILTHSFFFGEHTRCALSAFHLFTFFFIFSPLHLSNFSPFSPFHIFSCLFTFSPVSPFQLFTCLFTFSLLQAFLPCFNHSRLLVLGDRQCLLFRVKLLDQAQGTSDAKFLDWAPDPLIFLWGDRKMVV